MAFSLYDRCQWIKCSEIPTKQVAFSVRVFDSIDETDADVIPPDRRKLCDKHTEHVLRYYLRVTVSELNRPRMPRKMIFADLSRNH